MINSTNSQDPNNQVHSSDIYSSDKNENPSSLNSINKIDESGAEDK